MKERNKFILDNKYSVIDCGIYSLGDTYVIGENHKDAGKYLEEKYNHISSQKNGILLEKETEQKFDVQIWDSTDFIIDNLKEKLKNN